MRVRVSTSAAEATSATKAKRGMRQMYTCGIHRNAMSPSAQRLDVKLRAAGWRPALSGAPLAAHPIMPVQVARRRANSRRGSRLGRREKQRRTVNFNDELARAFLRSRSGARGSCCAREYCRLLLAKDFISNLDVAIADVWMAQHGLMCSSCCSEPEILRERNERCTPHFGNGYTMTPEPRFPCEAPLCGFEDCLFGPV